MHVRLVSRSALQSMLVGAMLFSFQTSTGVTRFRGVRGRYLSRYCIVHNLFLAPYWGDAARHCDVSRLTLLREKSEAWGIV